MARPANPNKSPVVVKRTTVNIGDLAVIVNGILSAKNTREEREAAINIFDGVLKASGQDTTSYSHLDICDVPEGEQPGLIIDPVRRTKSVGDPTRRVYRLANCPPSPPKVVAAATTESKPEADDDFVDNDGN